MAALVLLTAACSPADTQPSAAPGSSPRQTAPAIDPTIRSTTGVSTDPDALLVQARVVRDGGRLEVIALWMLPRGGNKRELVVVDGPVRRHVSRPSGRDVRRAFAAPSTTPAAESTTVLGRRLLPLQVPSLAPGVRVLIGGGDGATLLPFELVARSEEHDDWSVLSLPRFDGAMAYVSGAAALADGRIVALLDHFSDDRGATPGPRHHGLWVSDGRDWTAYHPFEPRFEPAITPREDRSTEIYSIGATREPDPVAWATTWDQRLYVSTDGMRTFHEVAAR